jgi:hypothetical protein
MAISPDKRPKAATIKQEAVTHASEFLQTLPEKPKEALSLREAVDQLRDQIRAALYRGYTYSDLAAMLSEKGIKISASTLKNYVPSGRRQVAKDKQAAEAKPKRRGIKGATQKAEEKSGAFSVIQTPVAKVSRTEPESAAEVELTTEEMEAPGKTQRRRGGKTIAKANFDSLTKAGEGTKTRRGSNKSSSRQASDSGTATKSTSARRRKRPPLA